MKKATFIAESPKKYLETFFKEKALPEKMYTVKGPSGPNYIPSETVIDIIINQAPPNEQRKIADMIRKIDFANGDIHDYLEHLAQAITR